LDDAFRHPDADLIYANLIYANGCSNAYYFWLKTRVFYQLFCNHVSRMHDHSIKSNQSMWLGTNHWVQSVIWCGDLGSKVVFLP